MNEAHPGALETAEGGEEGQGLKAERSMLPSAGVLGHPEL
jgi:hypothetical protein